MPGIYVGTLDEPSEGVLTALRVGAIIIGAVGFVVLAGMLVAAREWVTFGNLIGFGLVVGALFIINRAANPWQPLFTGSDLANWRVQPKGLKGVWVADGGVLRGAGTEGQLVSERGDFKNFHLRAEVKTNNPDGVVIGFRTPKTGSGPAVKLTQLPADTWCTYEMIAFNNQVTIKVDGKKMEQYDDKKPAPGGLSVQVTQPQTTVQFRSIEVREPLVLPVDVSWVLLGVVGLLSVEWLTRKLLKLA